MIFWVTFALLLTFTSFCLFRHTAWVESELRAGRVKIVMGEGIAGPSYQIAGGQVLGSVLGVCAVFCLVVALSYVGVA